jgi:predicted kinase
MAERQAAARTPVLVVMSGLSGSGKTWVSGQLMAALPAVRIRSDLERKRIFGLSETEGSASRIGSGIYTDDANRIVYQCLYDNARIILEAGHSVILDAAFLKAADRATAISIAAVCGLPCILLEVSAPADKLRERIRQRSMQANDASEAGLEVLEHQLASAEPFTVDEKAIAVCCKNVAELNVESIVRQIRARR